MATASKRKNKDGSYSYLLRASKGSDYFGKQIRPTKTWTPPENLTPAALKKELERQKVLFDEEVRNTVRMDGSKTPLGDFLTLWMKEYASTQLAPGTVALYRGYAPVITAKLGHIMLADLTARDLQQFYRVLLEQGSGVGKRCAEARTDLEKLLRDRGLSLVALKTACGLAQRTVSQAVNGRTVQKDSAEKIAAALGLPVEKLFRVYANRSGLDPATIARYHAMLGSVLQTAADWDIIPDNPARKAKPPKDVEKEAHYLTDEEALRLMDKLSQAPIKWRTICLLLLYGGFRRGEVAALEWKDIDFAKNTINIRHSAQYVSGMGLITKDPKSHKSQRRISLPQPAMEVLAEYRRWQAAQRLRLGSAWAAVISVKNERGQVKEQKNDRVFTGDLGELIMPDSITRWVNLFRTRHQLPEFTPHSLRHTNVSLMLAGGTPVQVVSDRVGHSSAAVTLGTYAHLIPSVDQAAADAITDMLTPEKRQTQAQ